ncbi:hypothetical protein AWB75_03663 [Caballeronia catudaia]|uniref:Uncharacterized protein n=1 Tax=Caballeronia catudaia TaxID=1777136 RepID=A0A158BLJ3_9BURK|nr:hypothetical protein AWB75_03663 [Caballeronia catudaia]
MVEAPAYSHLRARKTFVVVTVVRGSVGGITREPQSRPHARSYLRLATQSKLARQERRRQAQS